MPTDEKETQQRLRDAQSDPVETPEPTPNAQEEAESFGEVRERHQHWQFWILFAFAIFCSHRLYQAFFTWAANKELNENWHIGLMLILPATAILLSLVIALRHKRHDQDISDFLPQTKIFIDFLKDIQSILSK